MYCPRCGSGKLEAVYGNAGPCCVYCCKYLNETDIFSGELIKESLPVRIFIWALFLRLIYNWNTERRKAAKKRMEEHNQYLKENRERQERYHKSLITLGRHMEMCKASKAYGILNRIKREKSLLPKKEKKKLFPNNYPATLKSEDLTDSNIDLDKLKKLNFVPLTAKNSRKQFKQAKLKSKK